MKNNVVLVVDDEPDLRDLIQKVLESIGLKVITACDGTDAIQKAETVIPSILLTDLAMPNLDGTALIYHFKHQDKTKDVIAIAMSAIEHDAVKKVCDYAGADYFLQKPFRASELISFINVVRGKMKVLP